MRALAARPGRGDMVVAAAFAVAVAVETIWRDWGRPAWLVLGLGGVAAMVVLAYRRRFPLAALSTYVVAAAGATLLQSRLPDPTARTSSAFVPIIALLVLCYSVAAHGSRRAVLLGAPQPVLLVALVDLLRPDAGSLSSGLPFIALIVVGLPMLAGWLVRSRASLLAEMYDTERAVAEEHEQQLRAVRARESLALSERLAAELEVGLSGLHALAGRLVAAPGDGVAVLEAEARGLLAHTRHTVVALTEEGDEAAVLSAPGPGPGIVPEQPRGDGVAGWTILVAAAVGVGLVLETRARWHDLPLALLLCGVVVAALASAWWLPLECVAACWAGAVVFAHAVAPLDRGGSLTVSGLVVSTGFLVAWLDRRVRAVLGLLVVVLGAALTVSGSDLAGAVVLAGLGWLCGRVLRGREGLLRQVAAAHAELDRERAEKLRTSTLEQRAAVARDVHDAIGHGLTVVALQAGAALRLVDQDPAACARSLAIIERVAGQALDELRRGFGTTWDLDALVRDARASGLTVAVRGSAEPAGERGRVLQRVVQEALTNAMRHAPGAAVELCCEDHGSGTTVTVSNGAARRTPDPSGGGRGLAGMRERLAAAGGTLDWRHLDHGGFVLRAWLPPATQEATREVSA